jgi:hypothetical protein
MLVAVSEQHIEAAADALGSTCFSARIAKPPNKSLDQ